MTTTTTEITRGSFRIVLDRDAQLRGLALYSGDALIADGFSAAIGGREYPAPEIKDVAELPDGVALSLSFGGVTASWELHFADGCFEDRVVLTCPEGVSPEGFHLLLTRPAEGVGFMPVPFGSPDDKPRVYGADKLGATGEWEGVTFSCGGCGVCIAKHPSDERPVWASLRLNGDKLLFGGAAFVKRFDVQPQGVKDGAVTVYDFRRTHYLLFSGSADLGFNRYRDFTRSMGITLPENYDPPVNYCVFYESWFLAPPEIGECHGMDFRFLTEDMAQAAKALNCSLIYLDQGWDTVFGSLEWDEPRLRKPAELSAALAEKGLALGALVAMHVQGDCLPESVYMRGEDGSVIAGDPWHPIGVCPCSDEYAKLREERLSYLAENGVSFLSYDFHNLRIPCHSAEHGHPVPSDPYHGAEALARGQSKLRARFPDLLIESHDWYDAGGCHYPIYAFGDSHTERWGFEYMWKPLEDYASGRVQNLYWYNLAYDKPLYLHMDLEGAGDNAEVFWYYASVVRHLGMGNYTKLPAEKQELMRDAAAVYASLRPFFARGEFSGRNALTHIHTLDGEGAVVCLFAAGGESAGEQTFTAAELGLDKISDVQLLWGDADADADAQSVTLRPDVGDSGAVIVRVK